MPDSFCAWISRIAVSRIGRRQAQLRREAPADVAQDYAEMPSEAVDQEASDWKLDARLFVRDALRSLPDSLRVPLVMRHMSDAPYARIAEAMHITPNAAEKRVERALARIRQHLTRRGVEESPLPLGIAYPFGGASLGRVATQVRQMDPPARVTTTSASVSGTLTVGAVAGVVITCAAFVGAFLATSAHLKGSASSSDAVARVRVLAGRPAPSYGASHDGVHARAAFAGPIPGNAVLIMQEDFDGLVPGQALPGWTTGVYAQSEDVPPGGGRGAAMVSTNIPGAYYRFPIVQGIVTIEYWVRPQRGDRTNCGLWIGNHLAGWQAADFTVTPARPRDGDAMNTWCLVWKGSDGVWHCGVGTPGRPAPPVQFGEYDGEWHHIRVRYSTAECDYALYMDGRLVLRNVPTGRDLSAGVSWVALNSGRWEREQDEPSLFDSFRVYVEPLADGDAS